MSQVLFIAEARAEFLAEVTFYNKARQGLGLRFSAAVERVTQQALANPYIGAPAVAGTRRLVVQGFPFSLFYRPLDDGIVVFALAHHARRPGYWLTRAR